MLTLLERIINDHPHINFEPGDQFFWDPANTKVTYVDADVIELKGIWSLLHEIGHARLHHATYRDDLELLMMEVSAWSEAQKIAKNYNVSIEERHIETCVDSYRAWLHRRSRCIDCKTNSLQLNKTTYQCHNCATRWTVPESAMCKVRKSRVK
jgi:hypothetical protein